MRWLKILIIVAVALFLAFAAASAGAIIALSRNLPKLDAQHRQLTAQTTIIFDRHGSIIAELHAAENRVVLNSKQIPDLIKNATVASEDQRFYQHHGVDFPGLARALFEDLKAGSFVQGASTITEQFVKNAYVGNERSVTRKLREAVLAWELEDRWSKDQILTEYLNTVYYGNGSYGVEAAAQRYFHVHARQLTLPQAALLVAAAKLPGDYDPILHPDVALIVRNEVLDKMASQGYITPDQAVAAKATALKVYATGPNVDKDPASYFVSYVTQVLVNKYGYAQTFEGGLRVYTSLDLKWQKAALNVVKNAPTPPGLSFKPSTALVSVEPATGYIRVMVGGLDFKTQKFNLAAQAKRQPGSSMKPFVLAAAVERGMNPSTTYYPSKSPIIIPMGPGARPWVVHGDGPGGSESVYSATVISDNVVFAQLSVDVGPENTIDIAHRMGITSSLVAVPSITLGTSEVTPLEMADAYATLANGGMHRPPQAIVRVVLPDGKVDWKPKTTGHRAIAAGVAYTVTRALQGVATGGTGSPTGSYFPYTRAGKTGTTENGWDVWYDGYTPQLATAVWMGNMKKNSPMNSAYGGTYCAPIWAKFMAAVFGNGPHPGFKYAPWSFKKWNGHYATSKPSTSPSPSTSGSPSTKPTSKPTATKTIKPTPPTTPTPTHSPPPPPPPPPSSPPPSKSPAPPQIGPVAVLHQASWLGVLAGFFVW